MKRRTFIKTAAVASAITAVNPVFSLSKSSLPIIHPANIIKPKRLNKGDTVGLIAPAGYLSENHIERSIEQLEMIGFNVVLSKNIREKYGYLAGTDQQRIDDLHEMFSRNDIDGIFCARGGYGSGRILPYLDYELIKNNPKVLIGYSDITALTYGIFAHTGLVCFHGLVTISTFNEFSVHNFENVVMNPSETFTYINAEEDPDDKEFEVYSIHNGEAEGELVGGNLSLIAAMIGTKYDVDTTGKIIFIEEIREDPYRIDRMLTQMRQAGKFDKAAGVALGIFRRCEPGDKFENSLSLREVLFDRLSDIGIPVIYGLSFGHVLNKFTFPIGIKARLSTADETLTLLESAVL